VVPNRTPKIVPCGSKAADGRRIEETDGALADDRNSGTRGSCAGVSSAGIYPAADRAILILLILVRIYDSQFRRVQGERCVARKLIYLFLGSYIDITRRLSGAPRAHDLGQILALECPDGIFSLLVEGSIDRDIEVL